MPTTIIRSLLILISVLTGLMSIVCFITAMEFVGHVGAFIGTGVLALVSAQAAHYAMQ